MPKTTLAPKRIPPPAFYQRSRDKFQRTVQLTQAAIAQLETEGQNVTLAAICETTRELDEEGKGLKAMTILRNPEAAAFFRQHSPACQDQQQRVQQAKRWRLTAKIKTESLVAYRGLRAPDLIQLVESLKAQMAELQTQQKELQYERDAAYQLRDEALRQNLQLLAALTAKKSSLPPPAHDHKQ